MINIYRFLWCSHLHSKSVTYVWQLWAYTTFFLNNRHQYLNPDIWSNSYNFTTTCIWKKKTQNTYNRLGGTSRELKLGRDWRRHILIYMHHKKNIIIVRLDIFSVFFFMCKWYITPVTKLQLSSTPSVMYAWEYNLLHLHIENKYKNVMKN